VLINVLATYRKCRRASWRVGIPVAPIDPKSRRRPRHRKHIFAFDVEACRAATRVVVNISCHPFVLRALRLVPQHLVLLMGNASSSPDGGRGISSPLYPEVPRLHRMAQSQWCLQRHKRRCIRGREKLNGPTQGICGRTAPISERG
jgi:hypothetical protein